MTPHTTTDDDSSSSSSHPFQRPRQLSKTGSLPSPLGSYLHNDSLVPSNKSLQGTETGSDSVTSSINGYASTMPISSNHVQLRVRDLEHNISYSGYLTKFTSRTFFSRKQWKRRYFILHQSSIYCFKSSDPQHPLLESIKLCPDTIICVTDIFSGKRYCLQITTPGEKSWYVLADTANEMSGWLRELKGTVLRFRNRSLGLRPGTHYSDSSEMSDLSSSSAMADSMHAVPSIPTQYDSFTLVSRSPSPPPRPPPPPQQLDLYQLSTTPITHIHDTRRRRKNSSISVAQSHAEYASFGTIMEQADALLPEENQNSSLPSSTVQPDPSADDYRPPSRSASVRSNGSSNGRRVSIVVDRPETMITLPRRSSQRLMGSPSRPMSPVSSRPTSPNFNRPGNRSSLVVSPPPRSIHRPSSVSVRHSTQGLPLSLQMANMSMQSSDAAVQNPLSRATSLRLDPVSRVGYTLTGSLQERSYRSPSRPSIITSYSRPTSPTPSLSSAPTSPLPEAPRSDSPVSTLKHTFSNGSSHRIQIVPRHHDPDQLLKHRPSNSRSRTKSQETPLDHIAARANTPSPRLSAVVTKNENDTPTTPLSTSAPKLSLYNGEFTLPPPPTGEQPEPPTAVTSSRASSPVPGRPSPFLIHHKHSLSNSSLRSVGSSSSIGSHSAASFGSAICKKSSNRDSVLSARLSTLTPIPLGATVSVPSPPQMALPPIPIQEVSECSAGNDDEAREDRLPEIVEELPSQNEDPAKQQQ
ncbi:Pleckstrin y domain-containing A member 2 [Mortierella sp. AD011]|nr:Pleckstrin y domain-containing A member 2 [Mortierella sp. AD010]KAF9397393.1 Pleckstrin y domain-containing A member 2 [Mortierella sp. AD011]